jgi:hypothetical protein
LNGGGYAPFLWRTGFSIPQLRWISQPGNTGKRRI